MGAFFRRYTFGSLVAGVVVLTLGFGISGLTVTYLAKDLALWIFGRETTAHVTDLWVKQVNENEEGELAFEYFVEYQFTTSKGTMITKITNLAPQEWSGTDEGSPLPIIYFPPYPQHNRLEESQYIPILVLSYIPLIALSIVTLASGWHLLHLPTREKTSFALRDMLKSKKNHNAPV